MIVLVILALVYAIGFLAEAAFLIWVCPWKDGGLLRPWAPPGLRDLLAVAALSALWPATLACVAFHGAKALMTRRKKDRP